MKHGYKHWILAGLVLIFVPGIATAQGTAVLRGTVRAQSGAPIAGARVSMANQTEATGSDGRFRMEVAAGVSDTIRFRKIGFLPVDRVVTAPEAGKTRLVGVTMTQLHQLDALSVVAQAPRPLLNTSDASVGGEVGQRELTRLPIEGRDPLRLLFNVPGVAQGTGYFGDAPPLTFNGQNPLYVHYALDGLDNTEGFLGGPRVDLPLAGIARLRALVNSYSVAHGRSPTGVVDAESRAGGETARAELFAVWRPGRPLDALNKIPFGVTDRELFRRQQEGFKRVHVGGAVSAPLVHGRTFASGAAEYVSETEDRVTSTARTAFVGTEHRQAVKLMGRLDHGWSPDQTSTLRVAFSSTDRAGEGSGIVTPEADITTRRIGSLVALIHRSAFAGRRASNTAAIQLGTFSWTFPPTRSSLAVPQVTILDSATAAPIAVVGSSNFQFDESELQLEFRDVLEWNLGSNHTLRGGVELTRSSFRLLGSGTNPNGSYQVFDDPGNPIIPAGRLLSITDIPADVRVASYTVDAGPIRVDLEHSITSAFVEERWRATPTLNLVAGIRWDYDDITSRGESSPDLDNFQPRVSFNWYRGNSSAIRGGVGLYAGVFPYAIYSDARQFGPDGNAVVSFDSTSSPGAPAFGEGLTPAELQRRRDQLPPHEIRRTFARGLEQPMSFQATLGYQALLSRNLLLSIDGVYSRTRHLPRSYDLNAIDYALVPSDSSPAAAKPVSFGDALRPVAPVPGGFRRLTTTESAGTADYLGLYVTLRRRLGEHFSVDLDWTWSRARNNTEDINFAAAVGNDFDAEWADAINDRRHKVTLRGIWEPSTSTNLGVIADFQTGQPVNRVAGVLNPDGSVVLDDLDGSGPVFGPDFIGNTDRFYGVPRNGERLPSSLRLSVSAMWRPVLFGRRLEVRAEVFNLLNETEWGGFANGITGGGGRTQFGHPGQPIVLRSPGPPRQVQLSVRHVF